MALGPYLLSRIESLEEEARQCEENASTHERDATKQRFQAEAARKTIEYLRKSDAQAPT